jgi:hypothetical protein
MTDRKLMLLGAGPPVLLTLLMLLAILSGISFLGGPGVLATAALLAAMFFPALANLLRMRRS